MRTEPKSRILEAFSKFAETSRRGTGSAIGVPEQSSPLDHSFRPTGAPELLCGGTVVIAEQAAQSLTTSHLPVRTADAFFRFGCFALFAVGDVYASLCEKSAYAPFSARRRSRAIFPL